MPLYEYMCNRCGYKFEEGLKVEERHDPTYRICPQCEKLAIARMTSLSNFKIKGYSSKNGFSNNIGDIEKHLGREVNNNDFDD